MNSNNTYQQLFTLFQLVTITIIMRSLHNLNPIPKIRSRSPLTQLRTNSSQSSYSFSYASTSYNRYLSHFTPMQSQFDSDDEDSTYWQITTRCLLYLKRDELNTNQDDYLIHQMFQKHFQLESLEPQAITTLGYRLLKNGYFLAAYAIMIWRNRKKCAVFIQNFQDLFAFYQVKIGKQEMNWYMNMANDNSKQSMRTMSTKTGLSEQDTPIKRKSYAKEYNCDLCS